MSHRDRQLLARAGQRLCVRRKQLGLTRARFAQAAGVSPSSIVRLERGQDVRGSTYLAILHHLQQRSELDGIGDRIALLPEVGQRRVLELIRRFEESHD